MLVSSLAFVCAFLVSMFCPMLLLSVALIPWRRLPEEPWTERARRIHTLRQGSVSLVFVLPFSAFVVREWFFPEVSVLALVTGAVLGGTLSTWPLDRAIYPTFGFRRWLKTACLQAVINLGWLFILLFAIVLMPTTWSLAHVGWALGFLAATCLLSSGLVYKLFVATRILRPAGERAQRLVHACAAEAGVPVKAVWEIDTPAGFAAALVVQKALLFSTTTVNEHNDEEFLAICRHEIAHLTEGRWVIAVRVLQAPLSLLPFVFLPTFVVSLGVVGFLVPFLLWMLMSRMWAKLSVRFEKRADNAARLDGESSVYAQALERLHRRNLAPAILPPKAHRTHPDLYDRMLAAGVTPDYPRPLPPESSHWIKVCAIFLSGATMAGWLLHVM